MLDEYAASGLDPRARLPGNAAKIRLQLDLARQLRTRSLRVLDVGCAGPDPMALWAPLVPLADRLELVGVDIANLDRAEEGARRHGLSIELRECSAVELSRSFGGGSFDAVVSTQVLEHVREWEAAVAEMASVLRADGRLLLTCDSGHLALDRGTRARLTGKRAYARARERFPAIPWPGRRVLSGEWERGPLIEDLRRVATAAGLAVEALAPYNLSAAKRAQSSAGRAARVAWLAFEEAIAAEDPGPLDLSLYAGLYLHARRPAPAPRS